MIRVFLLVCLSLSVVFSDEGMWPFHQVPKEQIYDQYGFAISDAWLERVQKSCLRISSGGSGSFISPNGLLMTNHHVGALAIHHLSSEENNYFEQGFYAKSLEEELSCPNFYVDRLIEVIDITAEIESCIQGDLTLAEKEERKKSLLARRQKEAKVDTGLQPEIVSLYHGAKYFLYLYERFYDVRLVMAPEKCVASLGGDIDNFEYPRYSLDVCFFRVYDEGKPLETGNFFPISPADPTEQELLFVAGHPGRTKRMYTADHCIFSQEIEVPMLIRFLEERLSKLSEFSLRGSEEKRQAERLHHTLSNALKVYKGLERGLENPAIVGHKREKESSSFLYDNEKAVHGLEIIRKTLDEAREFMEEHFTFEGVAGNYSPLYLTAKHLVRLASEIKKPSHERLLAYIDTEIPELKAKILSKEPYYRDFEAVCLEEGLSRLVRVLGESHPLIERILRGKSPGECARATMRKTALFTPEIRKEYFENLDTVDLSKDPLIELALLLDDPGRSLKERKEKEVDAALSEGYAAIAEKEFEAQGESFYPDATFSLRLSLGQMKGYKPYSSTTNIEGLFAHVKAHNSVPPHRLSKKWEESQLSLNKNAPLNFVTTHDIIGGNSGSPVFNRLGEWVGLIFDGNAESIIWSHAYDDTIGRAISVHCHGIVEALQNVYKADSLVDEIKGGFR